MKILKKILSAGMAVVTALTATGVLRLPVFSLSIALTANAANIVNKGSCGENLTWTLDSQKVLTISGTGEMNDYNSSDSPFIKLDFSKVVILDGVTSIGSYAFIGCSSLRNISIPESVTSIGSGAFNGTPWLEARQKENPLIVINGILTNGTACTGSIEIPDNVTIIGDSAFRSCTGLTNITIPNSVTNIGEYAFYYCTGLESITIPNSVTSISKGTFSGCKKLKSIWIPHSVTSIGNMAFSGTPWLQERQKENPLVVVSRILIDGTTCSGDITIPNSVTNIGEDAFYHCTGLESITIPNSVTNIGNGAFSHCTGLISINIPDSVTNIGNYAFCWCTNLINITISDNVTNIGDYAFSHCTYLRSIPIPNSVTTIGDYAFNECSSLTSSTIPNGVTSIEPGTFKNCSRLKSIKISDRVKVIGESAFYQCSSLTDITLPNSLKKILGKAFLGCSALESIVIPDEVTSISIDNSAFNECNCLKSITIPESVTSIELSAFFNCVSLTDITILNPNCEINGTSHEYHCTIYGYAGSTAEAYAKKYGINFVVMFDKFVGFGQCGTFLTWTLDNYGTLTIRGTGEMYNGRYVLGTTNITNVPWKENQNRIKSVILSDGVTSIGTHAFRNCTSLNNITIPESVESIGEDAFGYCENLTDITILNRNCNIYDSWQTIFNSHGHSKYIFYGTIHGYAGSTAEAYATKYDRHFVPLDTTETSTTTMSTTTTSRTITTITSTSTRTTTTTLGSVMVSGRFGAQGDNLTWTLYDNGTLFISGTGKMADWAPSVTKEKPPWSSYISQIKEVVIENGVTNVGKYAFDQCTNLITVTISETVAEICEFAFCRCNILKSITFLNPNCIISDKISTICNSLTDVGNSAATYPFKGNIYGYDNSTAETYANKYDRSFISLREFSENGTTTTTTAITTTATSITNATTPIATTTITSITTTTTPIRNIEQIVYQIGDVTGKAGETIDVPVYVWNDPGTAGLSMKFAVEQGFMIIGWTIGKAYTNLNYSEFSHFSDEALLIWASADGKNQRAASGTIIITLHVAVPQNAKPGIHPISFVTGSTRAVNEQEQLLTFSETNGSITINDEPAVLTNMTTTSITSTTTPTAAMVSTTTTTATSSTNPTYTTKVLVGDVNLDGRISAADAQLTLNYYTSVIVAGNIRFQFDSNDTDDMYRLRLQIADVDGNDWVDLSDSQYILQYYLSQLAELTTQWVNITGVDSQAILDKKISSNTNLTL